MSTPFTSVLPNIVLVHGGFVDGSGWQGVHELLVAEGYRVAVVQNPTVSLEADVTATNQVLDDLDGPVVLVGHSYGGAVVTEAGTDERVAAVVYIAAFAPDKDESVRTLIADPPPGSPVPPILPPPAQRAMAERAGATVTESPGSHSVYVSDRKPSQS